MLRGRSADDNLAALRSVSLMRRCQPGPRARKWVITSRSRRRETSCLVGVFCGPRRRRYASTISGTTSTAGRARAHISSVISNASGSRAIPALISASSSSVISRAARSARRLASRHSFSECPCIFSRFILVRLAEADDSDRFVPAGKDKQVNPISDETPCPLSQLAVLLPIVNGNHRQVPLECVHQSEINLVIAKVGGTLRFVPLISRFGIHALQPIIMGTCSQINRIYDLRSRQ